MSSPGAGGARTGGARTGGAATDGAVSSLTWGELRVAVTVGTERRALPDVASLAAALVPLPPEQQALHAAALLGAARRAGLRPPAGPPPSSGPDGADPAEMVAPDRAVQLLELLLGGNLGRPAAVQPLVAQWLEAAAERGMVLPHHLVLAALDRGTADRELQPLVAPVLGRRGRWLAGCRPEARPEWRWATGTRGWTPDTLLAAEPAERVAAVRALRATDPVGARGLVEALWSQVDAPGRAGLLATLAAGLGPDDEALLERALDDRSGPVRAGAIRLLEGLPGSARAARCAARLAPVVRLHGRFRPTLSVAAPVLPEGDDRRDEPPASEAHWLRTLVAGAPLAWWERTLGFGPERIVGLRLDAAAGPPGWETDLVGGWARAATAQRNPGWAVALLDRPELTAQHRLDLVLALPGPWLPATADAVLAWFERQTKPGFALDAATPHLAAALPAPAADRLSAWLGRVAKGDDPSLHRSLRYLLQLLSTRISIAEAFP